MLKVYESLMYSLTSITLFLWQCLLHIIGKRRKSLDEGGHGEPFSNSLYNVFGCFFHELQIEKWSSYGMHKRSLTLLYSKEDSELILP